MCGTLRTAVLGTRAPSALGLVDTGRDRSGFHGKENKGDVSPGAHTLAVAPSPAWAADGPLPPLSHPAVGPRSWPIPGRQLPSVPEGQRPGA